MPSSKKASTSPEKPQEITSLSDLLRPYRGVLAGLLVLTFLSNGLSLSIPKILATAIDTFTKTHTVPTMLFWLFFASALGSSVFIASQNALQTYTAERVAKALRTRLIEKISKQDQVYVQNIGPGTLLTNLLSDVDAIKVFVSQAITSITSSVLVIFGASALLLTLNTRLAIGVLLILPLIAVSFGLIFSKVGVLFKRSQQILDTLNKVISESILGASLIRVLHAETKEQEAFQEINQNARENSFKILKLFSSLIPVITFLGSLAMLLILGLGGRYLILGRMTLGELAAFNSYVSMLIFPIILIGFMSNVIGRASASLKRISVVLNAPETKKNGTRKTSIRGEIEARDVSLEIDGHAILKHVSFSFKAGKKTAILGPTAAGKTQLLYLLTGLLPPTSGDILFDGYPLEAYDQESFHEQVGFVFQDSVLFNLSLRENIAFHEKVTEASLKKAISTAELDGFIETLPNGLETLVSERGTSLSGGQKQRIMLARALALDPSVLILDDFTARVDAETERRILRNLDQNYPHLTLISVTQKVVSVESYDHLCVLMEGDVIAQGTHAELVERSPEYMQILESQRSTTLYEDSRS